MWPFKYPYTNFHELNLDWIIEELQNVRCLISIDRDAYRFFTPSTVFGVMPGDAIPADLFSKTKKLLFTRGVYYLTSPVNVLDCDILCEDGVEFHGNSVITFTRSNIYGGRFAARGVLVQGRVNFTGSMFEAGAENVNDVGVLSGDVSFTNCFFDGKTTTRFGIWSDTGSEKRQISAKNCTFSNYFLNAIFSGATTTIIEDCIFRSNHTQTVETGGGQIDLIGKNAPNSAVISGCMFLSPNAKTSAIETEHAGNVTITNCYIDQTGGLYAFAFQSGGRALIENCTITRNENPALYVTEGVNVVAVNIDFGDATGGNLSVSESATLTLVNCNGATPVISSNTSIPIIHTVGQPIELRGDANVESVFFIWKKSKHPEKPSFATLEVFTETDYVRYFWKNDGTLQKVQEEGDIFATVAISSTEHYVRIAGVNLNVKCRFI